jgi:hypothetical protein
MRSVAFGEDLSFGTRLILFPDDKPDRFFAVIKFWMDATSGMVLAAPQELAAAPWQNSDPLRSCLFGSLRRTK